MQSNYWSRTLAHRISRRRALAATGATALGSAFLIACGSGNNNAGKGGSTSSGQAASNAKSATAIA